MCFCFHVTVRPPMPGGPPLAKDFPRGPHAGPIGLFFSYIYLLKLGAPGSACIVGVHIRCTFVYEFVY